MYHKTKSYRFYYALIAIFLTALAILCVLPIIHVLAVSFSGRAAAEANLVTFWPKGFTLDAYTKTIGNESFIRSFNYSLVRVVLGVSISMLVTIITAYPLSKAKRLFPKRNIYMWFLVFTMLFSGGLIPTYIVIQKLGLMNSIWVLILPTAVSVYNILLLLNFFRAIPKDLEEAALMDGCGQMGILWKIYVPVSMPSIATLSLFTLVYHWNAWFDGMIYMKEARWPLSTLLQMIIVQVDFSKLVTNLDSIGDISDRTVKSAQIFIGSLPVLIVYPFLQKYFVKGVMLGAVKE